MASRRGQGTPPPMPPGATGVAATGQASSSRSNSYPQMFSIDPSVNAFIRATWQAYYMGPWKSWRSVPDERRDSWWQTFVEEKLMGHANFRGYTVAMTNPIDKKTNSLPSRHRRKKLSSLIRRLVVSDSKTRRLSFPSTLKMASRRGRGTSPPMPPGATGVAATGQASSFHSNSYPQMSLNAMFNDTVRISQPHLHPDKLNRALWFSIDPSVNAFILATWQAYYMGPWKSWRSVPDERRNSWWQTFVQNFYWEQQFNDLFYVLWKKETWTSIEPAKKKSKKAAKSRKSDPLGKGVYNQNAGPVGFARIEYNMTVETGEPPSYTDLVRRTHTKKDGTFGDYRAEELVTQAEMEATQVSNTNSDGSPQSPSATTAPSRILLNQAYLKNAKGKRGHVYGLGSAQYREHAPSARVPASLARNLELELRVSGLETSLQSVTADVSAVKADVGAVKEDVATMKEDFAATRAAITELIQSLRPQANPQQQPPSTQAQDPSTQA
ncbi:hypothetical protein F2Q68_00031651 [Brassica cretica]|uniref:Uncharacterized protein n=1 Tax=Brassica cretica TaxID=69181 RepID=A0A8S9GEZ8_BRACR|nr:hypothetical protein F2Q68_00031651 [Brassica cretica]